MKIMVCGKGGAGKSALTVLVARVLTESQKVYIVDSDESNALLPRMVGAEPPKPLVEYLGGKKSIFKQGEVNLAKALAIAGEGISLVSLPRECVSSSPEGIGLLSIGKVREYGEGCACPFNFLARVFLKNLVLEDNEVVLVDTDAGVEHLGRGVEEGCDAVLTVADPTAESLVTAKILQEQVEKLGKEFWLILNKVTPNVTDVLSRRAKDAGLDPTGLVRSDEEVFMSSLEGVPLRADKALVDVEAILRKMRLTKP